MILDVYDNYLETMGSQLDFDYLWIDGTVYCAAIDPNENGCPEGDIPMPSNLEILVAYYRATNKHRKVAMLKKKYQWNVI